MLAAGIFAAGRLLSGKRSSSDGRPYRVLTGPLAWAVVSCPDGERPSMVLGRYEPHVAAAIRSCVGPGDAVIDVGAHIGYHSLLASQIVGPRGTVLAVEADARNARLLRANLSWNRADNATVLECAVADQVGLVTFASFETYSTVGHIADAETPGDAQLVAVPSTTIDELVFGEHVTPPRLIKIDVEGAELLIVAGATQVLETHAPELIVEVRRGVTLEPVAALLEKLGYVGVELKGSGGIADQGVIDVLYRKP